MTKPFRGEIYWADLSPVKESEQGGFRPVLILSNSLLNQHSPVVMIAPLTRHNEGDRVHFSSLVIPRGEINYIKDIVEKLKQQGHSLKIDTDSKLIGNQARAISNQRLLLKIGELNNLVIHSKLNDILAEVFAITACNSCFAPMAKDQLKCGNPRCKKRHRKKCERCNQVLLLNHKYCHNCGKEV